MVDLAELTTGASVTVAASSDALYAMVSDVTRMREWSPECIACTWDSAPHGAAAADGAGDRGAAPASPGAWFAGQNKAGDFEWETRCEVVAADSGREFAFVVGGAVDGWVRWGYRFVPVDGGTEVEESWRVQKLSPFMVDRTEDELLAIRAGRLVGIETTLANLKRVAEAS